MRVVLLFIGVASLTACHHPSGPTPKGEASFSIIAPAQNSNASSTASVYAIPPEPILPLATPVYPQTALASPKGAVTVGVRVDIDANGIVSGIQPSMAVFSTPNSYDSGFREAVEKAVAQWRFLPAKLQHVSVVKGSDGKDVLMVRDGENIAWSVDVAFKFTASGDVLVGTSSEHKRSE